MVYPAPPLLLAQAGAATGEVAKGPRKVIDLLPKQFADNVQMPCNNLDALLGTLPAVGRNGWASGYGVTWRGLPQMEKSSVVWKALGSVKWDGACLPSLARSHAS